MEWFSILTSITTLIMGGGWFVTYKSYKREKEGEATQAEANGWRVQQDVYQETIDDLKASCEYIRNDRNLLREENTKLRDENKEWREKYQEMEELIISIRKEHTDEINELKREMTRQGSILEGIFPFACAVVGCANRKRVEIQDNDFDSDNDGNENLDA